MTTTRLPFTIHRTSGRTALPVSLQSHPCAFMCTIMAEFHSTLFIGFNSLYLQAPTIEPSTSPERASNFLAYTAILCSILDVHHDWEENSYFPSLERFAGKPELFRGNVEQHHAFEPGLKRFMKYAQQTKGNDFDAKKYRELMWSFAPALNTHMAEEPKTFLQLQDTDAKGLQVVYKEQEKIALAKGDLTTIGPLLMGCTEKDLRMDGIGPVHPMPWFVPYLIHYVFSWRYSGLWEFNPCDFWGNRKKELKKIVWDQMEYE